MSDQTPDMGVEKLTQIEDIDFNPAERDRNRHIIDQAWDDLQSLSVGANAKLPEDVFVNVFLPFFAGEKTEVTAVNWFNVARGDFDPALAEQLGDSMRMASGSYREVDVIDAAGNVIFTVPPLLDRLAVRTLKRQRGVDSVSDIIHQARDYSNLSPMHGQQHLERELNERGDRMFTPHVDEYATRWAAIMARYGKTMLNADGAPVPLPGVEVKADGTTQASPQESRAVDPDDMELM